MPDVVTSMNCPNCGAPLSLQAGEIIVTCAYCGTASSLRADKKFFLAHSLIPNNQSASSVRSAVDAWMKAGFLKPVDLASRSRIESCILTYVPFFILSIDATTKFSGARTRDGTPEQKSETTKKTYEWRVLARRSSRFPVSEYALSLQGKETFDLGKIQKDGRFLNAEIDEEEAFGKAKEEIERKHRELALESVDEVREIATDVKLLNTEFLHVPVWEVVYVYAGKSYSVYVDGATREIVRGEFPSRKGEERSLTLVYVAAAIIILLGLLFLLL